MQYMDIICITFLLYPAQTDTHTINMHEQTDKHTGAHVIYTHMRAHAHRRSDKKGVPHSTLLLLRLIRGVMNAPDLMCEEASLILCYYLFVYVILFAHVAGGKLN